MVEQVKKNPPGWIGLTLQNFWEEARQRDRREQYKIFGKVGFLLKAGQQDKREQYKIYGKNNSGHNPEGNDKKF